MEQHEMTRRQALQTAARLTGAVAGALVIPEALAQANPTGPHTLTPLPFAFDALEPHFDAPTMQIHHDKHHQAYVNNLNKALTDQPNLAGKTAEDLVRNLAALPEGIRRAVQNNGGGHVNHSLFWQSLKKDGGAPKGELVRAIDAKFGGFDKFKEAFAQAATTVFGSGWAWLSLDGRELRIEASANQDTPLMQGRFPLLGIDVWEHAYYLKYQNRRPEYVAAFFNVIHWDFVSARYVEALKG